MHTSPSHLLLRGVVLAALGVGCHWSSQKDVASTVSPPGPSVRLSCPAEVSSQGPIPFDVVLEADARTYWDTQGVLDDALEILLIRRDSPGLTTVSKVDPAAAMFPPTSLPGRPSDHELARSRERITQRRHYDLLAHGRQHEGSAEYFVVATFAGAWDGPYPLRVMDPGGSKAEEQVPARLPVAGPSDARPPDHPSLIADVRKQGSRLAIHGGFRVTAKAEDTTQPFLSVLMAPRRGTERIFARQFGVQTVRNREDLVGTFVVPLDDITAPDAPASAGSYVFVVSVKDQFAILVVAPT